MYWQFKGNSESVNTVVLTLPDRFDSLSSVTDNDINDM